MKFIYSIVVLAICAISASQAFEARGQCNPNETSDQCVQRYAKQTEGTCTRILAGENEVTIQGCGSVQCGENLRKTPVDLSKPYPDCCSNCEVIDHNLPASMSGVAR